MEEKTDRIMKELDEQYQLAYEEMEQLIAERVRSGRCPAMGYTTNLDLLCDFEVGRLNELIKTHLPGKTLGQISRPACIATMEDLLETLIYFCANGIGGEVDVSDIDLVKGCFEWSYGMGGTAAQAAMALAAVGCPSVIHLTDDSREVCDILNSPFIYTVSKDGCLIHTDQVAGCHEQELHFIVQFKKGDIIELVDDAIEIPASNRVILTKITVNEQVPFSTSYFHYIEGHAASVSSNVLSSFNALLDEKVLGEHLNFVREHVAEYRKNNQLGVVFFEDAHYHDDRIRRLCLETIYSQVDIVSMNEEELNYTLHSYNFPIQLSDIGSCVEGAEYIQKTFGIRRGLIVHTKDYSMYVGDNTGADIRKGLIYGNLLATAKAAYGWYGNREQIGEVLRLPLSPKGVSDLQAVLAGPHADRTVLVPTRYIDKPKYTIGLGDSFVAGVQICF